MRINRCLFNCLMAVTGILFISSCASRNATGMPMAKRSNIIGMWSLTKISYENISESSVTSLLGDQKPSAFINSYWEFPNNGYGFYSFNAKAHKQHFYWSADLAYDTFQLKKINPGQKAQDVEDGFRMVLYASTKNKLTLKLPVEVPNGNASIILDFLRLAK